MAQTRGSIAAAVTVVTWASAFPAIRLGLDGFGPVTLGLARLVCASLGLAAVAALHGVRVPPRALWPRVVVAGLLGQALYQLLLMLGEVRVPAGTASMLIATAPLFRGAGAALLLGESARGRWPGMLVAFAGAALVAASLGLGGGAYVLAVLAAAACQGLYHVVVKPLSQRLGAFAATAWSLWAGALLMLPAAPRLAGDATDAPAAALGAAVFLGLVPSTLGYLTWSYALQRAPIAQTTAALYLVPVVAVALAWPVLGEPPDPLALAGGALAVAGVVLVRRPRALPRRFRPAPAVSRCSTSGA
jgi:drug/metabolite transporter (DMT)-like permease